MSAEGTVDGIEQRDPQGAWTALERGGSVLVDVRTTAEWTFVGVPDLSTLGLAPVLLEWRGWPDGAPNPAFVDRLAAELGDAPVEEIQFICRSGARSQQAATAVAAAFAGAGRQVRCVNVAEGFEGALSSDGRRGEVDGWRRRGLPWRQT
ncbi:MAG TPA: rhodanese-like domain-containing protein [Paracoccaceae bacterium]|nr:rhodanese-like domain-containing protein [Paracoccaceae bacterium]